MNNDKIDFYKQTENAIALLSSYGLDVRLKKPIRCISPNHDDRKPSASFFSKEGILCYNCFSCGFGGDVFRVLAEITGKDNKDIIKEVCGIEDKYKTSHFSHVLTPNKPTKRKESTKVYLTQNKADLGHLLGKDWRIQIEPSNCPPVSFGFWCPNTLLNYLCSLFSWEVVREVCYRYCVLSNATDVLYMYVDSEYRVSQLKPMRYKPNGHFDRCGGVITCTANKYEVFDTGRVRERAEADEYERLLFGEQFVRNAEQKGVIYAVEGEKSAIMLKCYLLAHGEQTDVVAVGGSGNIGKLARLSGVANVVYFPDIRKGVTIEELKNSKKGELIDAREKTIEAVNGLLAKGVDVSVNVNFIRSAVPMLNADLLAKGVDVADMIELIITRPTPTPEPPTEPTRPEDQTTAPEPPSVQAADTFFISDDFGQIPVMELSSHKYIEPVVLSSLEGLCGSAVCLTEEIEPYRQHLHTLRISIEGALMWEYVYSENWNYKETRGRILTSLRRLYSGLSQMESCIVC